MIAIALALAVCPPNTKPPDCRLLAERFYRPNNEAHNPCVQFADGTGGCLADGTLYRTPEPARFLEPCYRPYHQDPFIMDWIGTNGRYHAGARPPVSREYPVPGLADLQLDTLEGCSSVGACGRVGMDQIRCWTRYNGSRPFKEGEVTDLTMPAAMNPVAWNRVYVAVLGVRQDTGELALGPSPTGHIIRSQSSMSSRYSSVELRPACSRPLTRSTVGRFRTGAAQ